VIEGDVLHIASFNASSLTAREKLATSLHRRAGTKDEDVDWLGLLERFCRKVASAERASVPVLNLAEVTPAVDGADATWMIEGFPILKRHPLLMYGDGGTAKSHLLLRIAGCLAFEGLRVLYADWEFEPEDHKLRLDRLFGSHAPHIEYMRFRTSIFDAARQLARAVSEHHIDFLICDSVGAAAETPGCSLNDSLTANLYYNTIASVAPGCGSLHSAHVSRQVLEQAKGEIPQKPFGSAFWSYRARSSWYIKKQDDSRNPLHLACHHTKASTSALSDTFGLGVEFGASTTVIEPWELPVQMRTANRRSSILDRMVGFMSETPETVAMIAKGIGAHPETVRTTAKRHPDVFECVVLRGIDQWRLRMDEASV